MTRRRSIVLERPSGTGEIWQGGDQISSVRYRLIITQELLSTGREEVEGLKRVSGSIQVVDGSSDLFAKEGIDLHFEDGRQLPIGVRSPSNRGTFEIFATGQMKEASP